MSDDLYEDGIVRLARAAHGAGKLAQADASAMVDNPLCGDRVTVEATLAEGRVTALGHTVKGCLLCKASASMLGLHAPGLTAADVTTNIAALDGLLQHGAAPPPHAWPELAQFAPVAKHKSRFDCVRLPLQAVSKLLSDKPS